MKMENLFCYYGIALNYVGILSVILQPAQENIFINNYCDILMLYNSFFHICLVFFIIMLKVVKHRLCSNCTQT
jgi:hypothetical protein